MEVINHTISDRVLFEKQLLTYFKGKRNIVLLNSNKISSTNYFAVSDNDNLIDKDWQFGFISYDYKNQLEKLSSNNFDGIQFPEKHFFTPEVLFRIEENVVNVYYQTNIYTTQEIKEMLKFIKLEKVIEDELSDIQVFPRVSKEDYLANVNRLKKHIQLGDIYEINYCQEYFSENTETNPINIYLKLNEKSPTPFSCFVKCDERFLLSASPERYINKKERKIISQPIKGTIKRGVTKEEDELLKKHLFNDPKERGENIMIVDLVRNDLSKIAKDNSVKVDELCGIYSFPQVHQMKIRE